MKRILTITIAAVVILAAIAAPAGALAHGQGEETVPHACVHDWTLPWYTYHPTGYGGDYGCRHSRYRAQLCKKCGLLLEAYVDIINRDHINEPARDGGHNAGTRTHTFYQICINCRYRTNYIVPCAGPPCTVPSSIQYELN